MYQKNKCWCIPECIMASDLSPNAKIIYGALLRHAPGEKTQCWPGIDLLAHDTHTSHPTVLRALQELQTRQLLLIQKRSSSQGRLSSLYSLLPLPDTFLQYTPTNQSKEVLLCHAQNSTQSQESLVCQETNPVNQSKEVLLCSESALDNQSKESFLQSKGSLPEVLVHEVLKTSTLLPSGSSDVPPQQSTLFPDESHPSEKKKPQRVSQKSSPPLRDSNGHSLVHQAIVHFLQHYPEAMRQRYGEGTSLRYRPKAADGEQLKRLLSGVVVVDGEQLQLERPAMEEVLRLEEHFLFQYEDDYIVEQRAWTPAMFCAVFSAVQVDYAEWVRNGGKHLTKAERKRQEEEARWQESVRRAEAYDRHQEAEEKSL